MNFAADERALEFAARARDFVDELVIPLEPRLSSGELPEAEIAALQKEAQDRGLWAPQLPVELSGAGLDLLAVAPTLEAAGRSLLGPRCLGCAAPDEGNAHLLHIAANAEQRREFLEPLARGEIRSTFAMTELAPGAGSDPTMMQSRARRDGDSWVLDGHKWYATGAAGAAFAIVAAVSDPDVKPRHGTTLFLVPAGTPGYNVVREIPSMGVPTPGGHGEIEIKNCRVPASHVLGAEGEGFALMQKRLGPARLTHCMRWLGVAGRALDIAVERAREREAFGKRLADHQAMQWMLADSAIEIHAARLMVHEAAWKIAGGDQARTETSMCKVFVSEAINRVIDRAVQVCGSLGISTDFPLAHFYQEARGFRIYDGASEVHRMVVARGLLK